jgi:dCTP deaminase
VRLNDIQIIARLAEKDPARRIVISPMISAGEQVGPASVDIHLGTEFMVVERSNRVEFDPLMTPQEYEEWLKHVRVIHRYSMLDPFVLHPTVFVLATTLEFICLPNDIVARLDGRSSWARQGLKVHSTAGDIHPGSNGPVVFELENAGPIPILLYPGLAIAQVSFEELAYPVHESYADKRDSRYVGFSQSFFSAYPRDFVVEKMRLKKLQQGQLLSP